MDGAILKNQEQNTDKISSKSLEDHLNTLADIIIERILEEKNKNTTI